MEKCGTAGQATDDHAAHAHCMPDNVRQEYIHINTHPLGIFNIYCFSTATVVTRTLLSFTFIRTLDCVVCNQLVVSNMYSVATFWDEEWLLKLTYIEL